jgi:SAM-dependent methyltransferase
MKAAVARFYWSHLGDAQRVLDMGCGSGGIGHYRPAGRQVYGLDRDARRLAAAQPAYAWVAVWDFDAAPHLPFPDSFFDAVVTKDILEHLLKPWKTLADIHRVLRPGGQVLASVPVPWGKRVWNDYTHVRGFTAAALRQMFHDSGFEVLALWRMGGIPLTSRLNLLPYVPVLLRFPPFNWMWTSSYEIKARRI